MRKGLGCGAVGDTRVDLTGGQSRIVQAEDGDLYTAIMPRFVD